MTFDSTNVPPPPVAPPIAFTSIPTVTKKQRAYVGSNVYRKGAWWIALLAAVVALISVIILSQNSITAFSTASEYDANAGASVWLTISTMVAAISAFLGLLLGGIEQALVNIENYRNHTL